ncbi:MAG TPA: hypothetical protein VN641_16440 [Urbifossiella sp.]|nr:hypothetical protein [Urbifossiella sp.]
MATRPKIKPKPTAATRKKWPGDRDAEVAVAARESGAEPYHQPLRDRLHKVKEVDAVYVSTDDAGIVHVYSIVRDFGDFYERLAKQEHLAQQDCPDVDFEFHVRAHQGRKPYMAVPFESNPVFVR